MKSLKGHQTDIQCCRILSSVGSKKYTSYLLTLLTVSRNQAKVKLLDLNTNKHNPPPTPTIVIVVLLFLRCYEAESLDRRKNDILFLDQWCDSKQECHSLILWPSKKSTCVLVKRKSISDWWKRLRIPGIQNIKKQRTVPTSNYSYFWMNCKKNIYIHTSHKLFSNQQLYCMFTQVKYLLNILNSDSLWYHCFSARLI